MVCPSGAVRGSPFTTISIGTLVDTPLFDPL
jgi:hypothetical protein